ncbi:MAG TPA: hypothetical protein VFU93_12610 [Acidimicrobiales bacterium]|nr:hypothetical protein [Acidimicrobiales bacterium]
MNARRIAVGLCVAVLAACGGDDPAVSGAARDALAPRVAEIRALAESGAPESAALKLEELRIAVEELRAAGELSEEGARAVLEAAALVESQLDLITTTTQAPLDDEDDEDDEERDRPGRGRDKDDDD